jgi:hypothetical protein
LASVIDIDNGAVAAPSELPDPPPEQADSVMIENKKNTPKNNLNAFIKLPPKFILRIWLLYFLAIKIIKY